MQNVTNVTFDEIQLGASATLTQALTHKRKGVRFIY